MSHLTEALGTPVISIFGPTHESLGFAPHLKKSKVISKDIWCRPCSTNGSGKCFRSRRFCLDDIDPSEVFSVMKEVIDDYL